MFSIDDFLALMQAAQGGNSNAPAAPTIKLVQPRVGGLDANGAWTGFGKNGPVSYTHLTLPTICSV